MSGASAPQGNPTGRTGRGALGLDPWGAERRGCCNPRPERIRRRLISSGLHHPGQNCSLAPGVQESLAAEAAVAPHASGWGWGRRGKSRLELHRIPSLAAAEQAPVHQGFPGDSELGRPQDTAAPGQGTRLGARGGKVGGAAGGGWPANFGAAPGCRVLHTRTHTPFNKPSRSGTIWVECSCRDSGDAAPQALGSPK